MAESKPATKSDLIKGDTKAAMPGTADQADPEERDEESVAAYIEGLKLQGAKVRDDTATADAGA